MVREGKGVILPSLWILLQLFLLIVGKLEILRWVAQGKLESHRVLKNKIYFRCVWRKALLTGWKKKNTKKHDICLFWVKNRPFSKYLQKSLKLLSYTPTTNNASRIGKWWAKIDKVVDLIHFISDAEITYVLNTTDKSKVTDNKREDTFFGRWKQNWRWCPRQEN